MPRVILNDQFTRALIDAGVLPANCRRYIIDSGEPGNAITLHFECFGDERLLSVVQNVRPMIKE